MTKQTRASYRPCSAQTLSILRELNEQATPIFGVPGAFITAEAAEAAILLSLCIARGNPHTGGYRSFFANSRTEAAHGAVKAMRHARMGEFHRHQGAVLVLDVEGELQRSVDPLQRGPEDALAPGITCVRDARTLQASLLANRYAGLIIPEVAGAKGADLRSLLAQARQAGLLIGVWAPDCDFQQALSATGLIPQGPDLVISGERLTDYEIPFAALSAKHAVLQPWQSAGTAFLHTSTYGGNLLALRKALAHLRAAAGAAASSRAAELLAKLGVRRAYAEYVNAGIASLHASAAGALNVVQARGSKVAVELDDGQRRELLDCVASGGLGIGGHNRPDLRSEVLERHDPAEDYVAVLERALATHTGLARMFPGASGATAVETAMTLALLARPGRQKIVVFEGNFAGKTLGALSATVDSKLTAPFLPIYRHIVRLDPFASDAEARLRAELASGQIALVWMELVQGGAPLFCHLPQAILRVVDEGRREYGYLVGVDEILVGFYRTGRKFSFEGRLSAPDLLTVSKALSYCSFPISAALASEQVYRDALASDERLVQSLAVRYRHQLGAQIASHSLSMIERLALPEQSARNSELLKAGLEGIDAADSSIERYFVAGTFVRIKYRIPRWLRPLGAAGEGLWYVWMFMWWIRREGVFIAFDCFAPPHSASIEDMELLVRSLRRVSKLRGPEVAANATRLMLSGAVRRLRSLFSGSVPARGSSERSPDHGEASITTI